jgi:hypothetical protein
VNAKDDPAVALLLEASDRARPDPWLYELTDYRNTFTHREPFGANEQARALFIEERPTAELPVRLLRMHIPLRAGSPETCDALDRFVGLYGLLCRLAHALVPHAKHAPEPVTMTADMLREPIAK